MYDFWAFLLFRALVGIGEASYSTIAPAIISDLYSKDTRSKVLALFYFAIPVGTGLGYIVGSAVADDGDQDPESWRWGLRVTPFMGLVAIVLIIFFMLDPPRGQSENSRVGASERVLEDLSALASNKSYVLSTIAFTCVTFSAGALMWWGPNFAFLGAKAECGSKACAAQVTQAGVSYKFGIVMTIAGLIGVPAGSYVSQAIRHRVPNADPIVSGVSLLASVPVLYAGFLVARHSLGWCLALTFVAGLLLNCNWAIVSDMTLYVVLPTRRSLASAAQILTSHALGDAISPYLVGAAADKIRPAITPTNHTGPDQSTKDFFVGYSPYTHDVTPEEYDIQFRALQYALFAACFFQAFGGLFFLITSYYLLDDKAEAERGMRAGDSDTDREDDRAPIVEVEEGPDVDSDREIRA